VSPLNGKLIIERMADDAAPATALCNRRSHTLGLTKSWHLRCKVVRTNARSRSVHLLPKQQHPLNTEGIVHILFIDDHKDSADAFGEIASGLGHKVQVAYDGRSAMALTQTQSFDVVFFDIELPDADGRELCRRVRNEGASRDACVIAVTGRTDLRDKDLEPFDGYLHKPISAAALEHALKFSEG